MAHSTCLCGAYAGLDQHAESCPYRCYSRTPEAKAKWKLARKRMARARAKLSSKRKAGGK